MGMVDGKYCRSIKRRKRLPSLVGKRKEQQIAAGHEHCIRSATAVHCAMPTEVPPSYGSIEVPMTASVEVVDPPMDSASLQHNHCNTHSETCHKEEADSASIQRANTGLSRKLTMFQILLVAASMFYYHRMFNRMGWFTPLDFAAVLKTPPHGINAVNSLPAAFSVDKRGLTSYPDMVFFQLDKQNDHRLWFGGVEGSWVWTHGVLYTAVPPAALHAVSAGRERVFGAWSVSGVCRYHGSSVLHHSYCDP